MQDIIPLETLDRPFSFSHSRLFRFYYFSHFYAQVAWQFSDTA